MVRFSTSSGVQEKDFANGLVYKRDFHGGEAIGEYLVSCYLHSIGLGHIRDSYVSYSLSGSKVCTSKDFSYKYLYLSFASFIPSLLMLKKRPKLSSKVLKQKPLGYRYTNRLLAEHYSSYLWGTLSRKERVEEFVYVANYLGISRKSAEAYLSIMLHIDTIMVNTDRHLNNFGFVYDIVEGVYKVAHFFDHGMSLGVGLPTRSFRGLTPLGNGIKMQPFGTSLSSNYRAMPEFRPKFSVEALVSVLKETNSIGKALFRSSPWGILVARLISWCGGVDSYGLNIHSYLSKLEQNF